MKKIDIADVLAEGHRRSISFNDRRQEHLSKVRDGLTETAYEKMDEKFKDTIRMVEMRSARSAHCSKTWASTSLTKMCAAHTFSIKFPATQTMP
jgi:hypothetical protein